MKIIRKMGCTLWEPLWTNRWLFTDGNRQEEFSPNAGRELRVALCNLVFNFYQLNSNMTYVESLLDVEFDLIQPHL